MKTYTVVGYYSDDKIKYTGRHYATTPAEAQTEAEDIMGVSVTAVFEGIHTDLSEGFLVNEIEEEES